MDSIIIITAVLMVLTFLISELYIKRKLGIKPKRVNEERNQFFRVIDSTLTVLAFGAILLGYLWFETKTMRIVPVAFILMAKTLLRGFEEWKVDPSSKAYYHHFLWAGFTFILIALLLLY